ncbi:type II toxin-antitoxin system HicB family antitoxin [Candidatus Micrarchaeota archaeon]|nr:type II toxin-antitoxin system HicB family antitoxin [Candidatus Micrarchaeota archaeon]
MEYTVSVIVEKEDKWYVSHCIDLGVSSQGKTVEEALSNIKEAVGLYLEHAEPEELAHLRKVQKEAPIVTTISVS